MSWRSFSIRSQLMLLMLALLLFIQLSTMLLINWFDIKERRIIAEDQAQTLARSLNNDLLKTLLNPSSDNFAELSFRISGYPSVNAVRLLNEQDQPIFDYSPQSNLLSGAVQDGVSNDFFHLKLPISAEDHVFGYALITIDPMQFQTQIEKRFLTLLWILPFELLLGLWIAWRMSLRFTKPFQVLADVMKRQDMSRAPYEKIEVDAQNEVKALYDGYNQMMAHIEQSTATMRYMSQHDDLTGLFNRYAIEQLISQALQSEHDAEHVLLKLDLDRFKLINDAHGHEAGDDLLQRIAQSMLDVVGEQGEVARVGGDDFIILLPGIDSLTGRQLAERLQRLFKDYRFIWQGEVLSVSASIGMVAFRSYQCTVTALLQWVDAAFYIAKSAGINQLHEYHNDDINQQQFDRDIKVAGYLKEALSDGPARFELFAQAIVPLQQVSDKVSYEILLRLWDSAGQLVSPADFLPTAERYQLMTEIDRFVLWTYLSTVSQHPEHLQKLHVAHVNLSGASLNHPDFQRSLREAVSHFSFPWSKLELEVTETSAVGNLTKAIDFIAYCNNIGIGFALDDFGTGMSSFEYLKHLPFNVVKIDGSFIKDMHKDPLDLAVIRYIKEISDLRHQQTVAEYVESEADVQLLTKIGITYGQGYYLGKPKPLKDWLAS